MLARALLAACVCACALASTPLSAASDDNDCALYLSGPGRTSAFDYNLNLLRGNFGYEGQHTCITYEAVNHAYLEARKRIVVAHPKGDWKPEDYASVGELILDISINIAKTYGLTYEEIEKALPLIDTSRTLIREVCPPIFSHVECRAGKYRRLDGLCNNLQHPTWGATMSPFQRLIGPLFADGINAPRISHSGHDLPLSRVVSRTMHPDDGFHDHAGTIMVIAWGQFMDHDYTLTGTPLDPINRNDPEECCKRPPHLKHPYCNEIRIPDDDYFYRLWGVKCIDFVRAFPSPRPGCRLGSRAPYNTLTGALDGNTVYGVTEKFSRKLRTGYGGLLRMNPVFKEYGLKDLLPLKLDIPDEGCTRPNKNMYCFEAGEIRVNEQLVLTVMHTLMAREHNRVAEGLAAVNPHWDDETLFQESRRINIAEIQHITYNEFLPILLGKDVMEKFGLVLEKHNYWDGYDQTVNPDVIASFAAAAYRFGHSLLPTAVERWSKSHKFIASKRLSDLIRRPYDLYRAGVLDEYVMGLMNQVAQAMDDSITQEVTNHLFKKIGARFGMDLVSFNMQRGREFGVPGYMEFRKFCGLNGANTFQELFGSMPNETVRKYETIFEHPIDVDLWSGGVSERPLPGSMLGPTFACIIATQFSYSRRGDRFWYELPNQPSSFTPEQLAEVRKARLARIICDNTDIIDTVQLYPMVLPDHELNPRVPCRSGIIPSIDFSKWAEPPPAFPSAAKQFITDAILQNDTAIDLCKENTTISLNSTNNNVNLEKNNMTDNNINTECNDTNIEKTFESSVINETIKLSPIRNDTFSNNCTENDVLTNDISNKDTVLKYVYKKHEIDTYPKKSTGHKSNSLNRKKRTIVPTDYVDRDRENIPVIVNYETRHAPASGNIKFNPLPSPFKINPAAASISEKGLADFNIETLHENIETLHERKNENNNQVNKRINNNRDIEHELIVPIKDRYKEQYDVQSITTTPTTLQDVDLDDFSYERIRVKNGQVEAIPESSNENSNERNNSQDEVISTKSSDERSNSDEKNNSYEKINSDEKNNSEERNNSDELNISDERNNRYERKDNNERKDNSERNDREEINNSEDRRDSGEGNINHENKNSEEKHNNHDSYRGIERNNSGESNNNDESSGSNENNDSRENSYIPKPESKIDEYPTKPTLAALINNEQSHENDGITIKVNNGEIKPVVEITEDNSSEENYDNNNDNLNFDKDNKNILSGSLKINNEQQVPEINVNKKPYGERQLKQQFERIPLNYKHDEVNNSQNNNLNENDLIKNTKNINDATEEPLPQIEEKYDENLNFKFDDISIRLPEIKLPDDILSYNYDEPSNNYKEKEKQSHYSTDDNDREGNLRNKNRDDNEDINDYSSFNNYNRNSNRNNDEDEDEDYDEKEENEDEVDLYEKFVRERFGKKGYFGNRPKSKRSENLKEAPMDPALYKTINTILNKTMETTKQAENSGDPKAGYMWTLEYGQQL